MKNSYQKYRDLFMSRPKAKNNSHSTEFSLAQLNQIKKIIESSVAQQKIGSEDDPRAIKVELY